MDISTRTIDSPLGNWLHAEWRPAELTGLTVALDDLVGRSVTAARA